MTQAKAPDRDEIARQTAQFIAAGGRIDAVEFGTLNKREGAYIDPVSAASGAPKPEATLAAKRKRGQLVMRKRQANAQQNKGEQ